jgi:hypothetical protein
VNAVLVEAGPEATGAFLAQDPAPPPGKGPEFGEASPLGLLVVILLGVAVVFLVRSMTKHLKRVPASFDPPEEKSEGPDESEGSDAKA